MAVLVKLKHSYQLIRFGHLVWFILSVNTMVIETIFFNFLVIAFTIYLPFSINVNKSDLQRPINFCNFITY